MKAGAVQNADISWDDADVPIAKSFDDPYFSRANGLAETQHVFMAGNDLPARFTPGFQLAELGFGTGLNALVAGQAWGATGLAGRLIYTGFEAFPLRADDATRALSHWDLPDKDALLAGLRAGQRHILTPSLDIRLIFGDARNTLAQTDLRADAWFLDGFSPAKNPELWGADLLSEVARHTADGGTFATYTAAGHVRRALTQAGFAVQRCVGHGQKKHMSRGRLNLDAT